LPLGGVDLSFVVSGIDVGCRSASEVAALAASTWDEPAFVEVVLDPAVVGALPVLVVPVLPALLLHAPRKRTAASAAAEATPTRLACLLVFGDILNAAP